MKETKYELPAWCNGLIIFLFTPALLFVIGSAVITVLFVIVAVVIVNFPWAVWCALTGRHFEYKFFAPIEKQKKDDLK